MSVDLLPSKRDHRFHSLEIYTLLMNIEAVFRQFVVHVLLGDFPVTEVMKNIASVAHLDEPSVLPVIEIKGIGQVCQLEVLPQLTISSGRAILCAWRMLVLY